MNEYQNQFKDLSIVRKDSSVVSTEARKFLLNVYNWMAMGLALTAIIAYGISTSETLLGVIFSNRILFWGIIILQFGVVIALSAAINKMPVLLAIGAFFLYAALTGLTLSSIFVLYTRSSIASTFLICSLMFGSVSVFGYITKMDLSRFGTFMFMGLIGIIIASVVNIFLKSSMLYWIISYAGVVIFVGLTAWDTQKLKRMSQEMNFDSEQGKKAAVLGALTLYLDFINMFLFLLRIMGSRK
ncbi:MAG TPA: Bax inhibitor-1/YccA family protein [Ignavibacteria bacterium]